jgi:hypothetical protein
MFRSFLGRRIMALFAGDALADDSDSGRGRRRVSVN